MVILVDFDDVLINTGPSWVSVLNEKHGTNVSYDEVVEWGMDKFFPTLTHDEIYEPLVTGEVWSRVSPIPGARETIERMISDGHDVYIVTSSSLNTIGKKWNEVLQKFFPVIHHDKVIVAQNKQMIRGDVIIDDAPFNIRGGCTFGILFDTPHNRGNDAKGLFRATSWNEIYKFVCSMQKVYDEVRSGRNGTR